MIALSLIAVAVAQAPEDADPEVGADPSVVVDPEVVPEAVAVAPPSSCPPRQRWPDPDWEDISERIVAHDLDDVRALEAFLFPPDVDLHDKERRGTRTDGAIVVHQGRILYEAYGRGYEAHHRHLIWSATKTVTQALTGIAVREGALSLDDSICDHIAVGNPDSCQVTVRHLLEWSSGWDWAETYENGSPVNSSVAAMLYGEGATDMARFVTSHPLRDPPGTTFSYSSGDTTVLAAVVGAALTPRHGDRWPWALLFEPLGMTSATFEADASGTYVGGSLAWMTPRDMARFGYFLLNDGCWRGERLLPEGWLAESRQVIAPFLQRNLDRSSSALPGRSLWLNTTAEGHPDLPWPHAPDDTFAALGHWKQMIVVTPSRDLVVVRTGDDRDGAFDRDELLRLALALIPEEAP